VVQLLGPNGQPISSEEYKKATPPKLGTAFGPWAGRDLTYANLPGGGIVQFDLNKLTLSDYRAMRDHYQVNASISVLAFMQHQANWHIECEDKKIADHCEENLRQIWTPLNRSLATANWAGYSPNVLQWENDANSRTVQLTKILDLIPEETSVHWKEVQGYAPPGRTPPKIKVYDGIKMYGVGWPVPVDNTFWYTMLMENGDYYGRKLLRPAFQPWFFSYLIHLFANRYYERFGEPTPVGRAPFDDDLTVDDAQVRGNQYMGTLLSQLRNRSVVVLPNDATDFGNGNREYDYDIEYLESQMRGADFERYLTRLDEEMSLGIFTPILLMRTADVGSYNLGVGHMQLWLWMLNALNGDRKFYIDHYLLQPMRDINFSPNAPRPEIVFQKLGNTNVELIRSILTELLRNNKVGVDLVQLGEMAGLDLKEIRQLTDPTAGSPPDPNTPPEADPRVGTGRPRPDQKTPKGVKAPKQTGSDITARVRPQVENAFRDGTFGPDFGLSLGYRKKFERALIEEGFTNATTLTNEFFNRMERWLGDALRIDYTDADDFMQYFERVLENEIDALARS